MGSCHCGEFGEVVGRHTHHYKLGWWCTHPCGQGGGGDVGHLLAIGGVLDEMVVWALIAIGCCHGMFMSVNDGCGWLLLL